MKEQYDYTKWTLHHTWVILVSYITSTIVLLIIHGSFGFSMNDDGTYLSNALMHIGSGFILALGTGILQKELLKKYFNISNYWVLSLIIGFLIAELLAGLVLWKLEVYRGLINIFNCTNHFPEASIFAFAGLVAGILQFRLLRPYYRKRFYWLVSSALGWSLLILSTYLGLWGFILGAALYGAVTGIVFFTVMESKTQNQN